MEDYKHPVIFSPCYGLRVRFAAKNTPSFELYNAREDIVRGLVECGRVKAVLQENDQEPSATIQANPDLYTYEAQVQRSIIKRSPEVRGSFMISSIKSFSENFNLL